MMWFPELPDLDGDYSGILCIPETIEYDEDQNDGVDHFVQALIESMSRPLKGGHHGED